jgi:hypothetical protein
LHSRTRVEGKAYCVNINLFGYVIPKKCIYKAQGQYMELKLHKSLGKEKSVAYIFEFAIKYFRYYVAKVGAP